MQTRPSAVNRGLPAALPPEEASSPEVVLSAAGRETVTSGRRVPPSWAVTWISFSLKVQPS